MTQELGPIITQVKGTFATGFKGQISRNELLLIFHEPSEQFPERHTIYKDSYCYDSDNYIKDVTVGNLDATTSRRILSNGYYIESVWAYPVSDINFEYDNYSLYHEWNIELDYIVYDD